MIILIVLISDSPSFGNSLSVPNGNGGTTHQDKNEKGVCVTTFYKSTVKSNLDILNLFFYFSENLNSTSLKEETINGNKNTSLGKL